MTEAEWLACADPLAMLTYLSGSGSESPRKMRLYAVACCRLFWATLDDYRFRGAVEVAEQFADNRTSKNALRRARQGVRSLRSELTDNRRAWTACWLAEVASAERAVTGFAHQIQLLSLQGLSGSTAADDRIFADFFRELFGPLLFRPLRLPRSLLRWNGGTVKALAQSLYDEGRWNELPILADALEDAGCQDDDILRHCRDRNQPHVKGCWVVDALLEKR